MFPAQYLCSLSPHCSFICSALYPTVDREWTSSRTVDLNPDPHGVSDRPEWCTVIYDSVFIPQVAFQMEFQWVVTTATLLAKQASSIQHNLLTIVVHICRML